MVIAPARRCRTAPMTVSPRRPLARRSPHADPWHRFLALARQSRSAGELLIAVLHRPVYGWRVTDHLLTPSKPLTALQLTVGEQEAAAPVRIVEHRLIDSQPPHRAVAFCSTAMVPGRLPPPLRAAARDSDDALAAVLQRAGAYWTAETLQLEQLHTGDASWGPGRDPGTPMIRLTRVLYLIGAPVALVVEEIPLPAPPARTAAGLPGGGRSPPADPAAQP